MFSEDLTRKIVKGTIESNFGVTKISDHHIIIDGSTVTIKLGLDFNMNVLEMAKILQHQIFLELKEKTDYASFKVNVIVGE